MVTFERVNLKKDGFEVVEGIDGSEEHLRCFGQAHKGSKVEEKDWRVRDEEVVVGEGVVRFSSSFVRSTNSCFGGMMMSGGWLIKGGGGRIGVTTSSRAMILSSLSLLLSGKRVHDTIVQDDAVVVGLLHEVL
ncbi:hypothetical protein Tco_0424648 [Tanacetum coccineum]